MSESYQPYNRLAVHFEALDAKKKKPAPVPASPVQKRVFELTDAVTYDRERVHLDLHEGYELVNCDCGNAECNKLVFCMNVTRSRIIEVFETLVCSLGETVTPIFIRFPDEQTSIEFSGDPMDTSTLLSELDLFEQVILNDGHSQLIVANIETGSSVMILPHRMIALKALPEMVDECRKLIEGLGFKQERRLETIYDHVYEPHSTSILEQRFGEMVEALGMTESLGDDMFNEDPDVEENSDD